MGAGLFDLDLLTIMTAYVFLFYGRTRACAYAFGQGFLIDLFSGGLHGLFTLLYLCVFACIYLTSRLVNLHYPRGQIILISLAVLLKEILLLMVLIIFSREIFVPRSCIWVLGFSAMATGLITPAFFYLFDRLRTVFLKASGNAPEEQI